MAVIAFFGIWFAFGIISEALKSASTPTTSQQQVPLLPGAWSWGEETTN